MLFFAQLPGADQAIESAASRSWEAVLLACIVVSGFTFLGWILRRHMEQSEKRECRLAERVTRLEEKNLELGVQVAQALSKSTFAMEKVATVMDEVNGDFQELCALLRSSPCLLLRSAGRDSFDIVDKRTGQPINILRQEEQDNDG